MIDTPVTQSGSRPVLYRLIDKHGIPFGPYASAKAAAEMAKQLWPDQEQDEIRSGNGWDIEVVS